MVFNLGNNNTQLSEVGLLIRFMKVLPESLRERLFPLYYCIFQLFERRDTSLNIKSRSTAEIFAL